MTAVKPFSIAVYNNLPTGGAKMTLFILLRDLRSHCSRIDLFQINHPDNDFCDIGPLADRVTSFDIRQRRPLQRSPWINLSKLMPLYDLLCHRLFHRTLAAAIDRGQYDAVIVAEDRFTHIPMLLLYLETRSYHLAGDPVRVGMSIERGPAVGGHWARMKRYIAIRAQEHIAGYYFSLVKKALERTQVVVNSEYSQRHVREKVGFPSHVLPLGVDVAMFRPLNLERKNMILSVGALTAQKRHILLLESVAEIEPSIRPNVVIAYSEENMKVREQLLSVAAERGIHLTLIKRPDNLAQLYNRAKVFLFTAEREPFGLVVLEAMACGTAVVSVDEGGPREIIRHGETGYLVPAHKTQIANAVMSLLQDDELRRRIGERARADIEVRWTWKNFSDNFLELLKGDAA